LHHAILIIIIKEAFVWQISTAMAPLRHIAQVPKSAVHRIASGQVILDLSTAVKELLENALDAGATNIEVQ
jgi:DNA mismatch repair ATPase MutL